MHCSHPWDTANTGLLRYLNQFSNSMNPGDGMNILLFPRILESFILRGFAVKSFLRFLTVFSEKNKIRILRNLESLLLTEDNHWLL